MIKDSMKKLFVLCMCSLGLYGSLFPQSPTETPIASPTAATAATSIAASASTPTAAPSATSNSASSDLADKIHRKLEKKLGHKHGITIDTGDKDEDADLEKMHSKEEQEMLFRTHTHLKQMERVIGEKLGTVILK